MDCKEARELIWDYVQGSLDAEISQKLKKHLLSCSGCRTEKSKIERVLGALSQVERIEPDREFTERLWRRIETREAARRALYLPLLIGWIARNRKVIAACSVAFVVALLGGMYLIGYITSSSTEVAKERAVVENYVLREIPEPTQITPVATEAMPSRVYTRYVTRDIIMPRPSNSENFVLQPVDAHPQAEPAF